MKVDIYIDWENQNAFTEAEAKEVFLSDYGSDLFNDWLEDHYTTIEIFNLTEKEKNKIHEKYAQETFEQNFDKRTFEI